MKMRRTKSLIAAGALLLISALMLLVEVRLASSNTTTQSEISKFTMGVPQGEAAPMPGSLQVTVEGSDPLAAALKRQVRMELGRTIGIGDVRLLDSVPAGSGQPVAVLGVGERDVRWTPVYSRSTLSVSLAYASDGEMSWRDETPVKMGRMDGRPQIRVRGTIDVADVTTGVISEPAYRQHLAEQVTTLVGGALRQQFSR